MDYAPSTSSNTSADSVHYDVSHAYSKKSAALRQVGESVAKLFEDNIIYFGKVIGIKHVAATEDEPAHYLNIVEWTDGETSPMWRTILGDAISPRTRFATDLVHV